MKYSELLFGNSDLDRTYIDWYLHPEYFNGDCSAFYQHMPIMRFLSYGKEVVELGARYGVSTLAVLSGRPKSFISIDIDRKDSIDTLEELARRENIPFTFIEGDDLKLEIPECDILFIDTLHDYAQLHAELFTHGNKAREYIIGHDLVSFGERDESDPNGKGLVQAIEEFLFAHPHWESASYWFNCNGLWMLRRK